MERVSDGLNNLFTLIIGKDERGQDIRANFYVDNNLNIVGINFAGITFTDEEIKLMNFKKMDKDLFDAFKNSEANTLNIVEDYIGKTPEEILDIIIKNKLEV
ncbi:hypothetical protein [Aliarcobacter butzleri]|uniref:hypothetical protein n=1 Tax=Aliarcobacter butzleri TaxID=28197 RepID=UPI002B2460B6|nr:hypothetical protein [Aliarcobacter butzleri]